MTSIINMQLKFEKQINAEIKVTKLKCLLITYCVRLRQLTPKYDNVYSAEIKQLLAYFYFMVQTIQEILRSLFYCFYLCLPSCFTHHFTLLIIVSCINSIVKYNALLFTFIIMTPPIPKYLPILQNGLNVSDFITIYS